MRVIESRWECMRSWRSNESESLNSHQLLIETLTKFKVHEGTRESMGVHESWQSNVEWEFELSSTLIEILNTFKVDESAREAMRVHESWRSNESDSLNSHLLSSKFWTRSKLTRALDRRLECTRAGGQTRVTVWSLIDSDTNFRQVQSWWERSRVDESAWEVAVKRVRVWILINSHRMSPTLMHSRACLAEVGRDNLITDATTTYRYHANYLATT